MERFERELIFLSAPPACLTVEEQKRALRLVRKLARVAAEDDSVERARPLDYVKRFIEAARAAELMTGAAEEYWDGETGEVDSRAVLYASHFALVRARAG